MFKKCAMRYIAARLNAFLASFVGIFLFGFISLFGFFVGTQQLHAADVLVDGFDVEYVAGGLNRPTAMSFAPDGRIFVAEKSGSVRIFSSDLTLQGDPFITLTDVNDFGDRGLIGIALDPDFASNRYVYLAYTHENDPSDYEGKKTARVVRFTESGGQAVPGSASVIIGSISGTPILPSCADYPSGSDCVASDSSSHTIGGLRFGPDGKLYISTGDGARFDISDPHAFRAQDLDHLSGKILRVNPDGSAPTDNPFFTGDTQDNESKVFAYGFRNPYRFNFDPRTGLLVVADVGWGEQEEFDVVEAGKNYGWPCREGTILNTGYSGFSECPLSGAVEEPDYTYDHIDVGSQKIGVITGGAFAVSDLYPESFRGSYTFADAAFGWIKSATFLGTTLQSVDDFAEDVPFPVEFVTGEDGLIYLLTHYSGEIRRITYTGEESVQAALSADVAVGVSPLTVNFSAAGSVSSVGSLSYVWDFGDGTTISTTGNSTQSGTFGYSPTCIPGSDTDGDGWGWDGTKGCLVALTDGGSDDGDSVAHTYVSPGVYTATLTATSNGISDSTSEQVTVLAPSDNDVAPFVVSTSLSDAPYYFGSPVTYVSRVGNASGDDSFIVKFEVSDVDGNRLSEYDYVFPEATLAAGLEQDFSRELLLPIADYSIRAVLLSSDLSSTYDSGDAQVFSVITRVPGENVFGYSPTCIPGSDTDGDGWGWDGTKGCLVALIDEPVDPVDPDTFGYSPTCIPGSDTDGDGWGWDGTKGCLVALIDGGSGGDSVDPTDSSTQIDGVKYTLYESILASGWSNWSWNIDASTYGDVIEMIVDPAWGGLYFHADTPKAIDVDDVLTFAIKTTVAAENLFVSLYDGDDNRIARVSLADYLATDGTQQVVAIPVGAFIDGVSSLGGIILQGNGSAVDTVIEIDDVLILE